MSISTTSFDGLWKKLQLYVPAAGPAMVQDWVSNAYNRAIRFSSWSQLRSEVALSLPAAYADGTITMTSGSTTVTGAGTAFTSAMVNLQLAVGNVAPFYSIAAVDVALQTLTLDRVYVGDSASGLGYSIRKAYIEMPADFASIEGVLHLGTKYRLQVHTPQGMIDIRDPQRTASGSPSVVGSAPPRITTDGTAVIRYELWPTPTTAATLLLRYNRDPGRLISPTDYPIWPITEEILRYGALAEAAIWPGVETAKNIYYDLALAPMLEEKFSTGLRDAWKRDQEIAQTAISYDDWSGVPLVPLDSTFLQTLL